MILKKEFNCLDIIDHLGLVAINLVASKKKKIQNKLER